MEYARAGKIRSTKLSSLIADRITSGGTVTGSIRGAISDKLKAKATGLKEKFDPLNIARAVTGGGRLAPAVLGRMLGRSTKDIKYFTRRSSKSMETVGKMPSGYDNEKSEGLASSLNSIYNLLRVGREREIKLKEIEQNSLEEKRNEDERRHQEFLNVLREFTGVKPTAVAVAEKKEETSFADILRSILAKVQQFIEDFIGNKIEALLEKFLTGRLAWLASSLAPFLKNILPSLGILTTSAFLGWLNTLGLYSAAQRRKDEAILDVVRDVPKGIKGREPDVIDYKNAIKTSLENKTPQEKAYFKKLWTEHPELSDEQKSMAAKAIEMIEKPASASDVRTPTGETMTDEELKKRQKENWEKFNKPTATPAPEEPVQTFEVVGKRMADKAAFVYSKPSASGRITQSVPPNAGRLADVSSENAELNMIPESAGGGSPVTVNQQTKGNVKDKPIPSTPRVRDDTPILERSFDSYVTRY